MADSNDSPVQHWGTRWTNAWMHEAIRWMITSAILGFIYIITRYEFDPWSVVIFLGINAFLSWNALRRCRKDRPDFHEAIPTSSTEYYLYKSTIRVVRNGKCIYEGMLDDAPDDIIESYNWTAQQDKKNRESGKKLS